MELELEAKRKRKELRAKKRAAREAKAQNLKSKSNTHTNNLKTNYNTPRSPEGVRHFGLVWFFILPTGGMTCVKVPYGVPDT